MGGVTIFGAAGGGIIVGPGGPDAGRRCRLLRKWIGSGCGLLPWRIALIAHG